MQYYAKEYQDRFVHKLIGGRGTYLELGSHHPFEGNNTAALEWLGWKGISIDFQDRWINLFNNSSRRNPCVKADVTTQNFIDIMKKSTEAFNALSNKHFNYISLDVDEAAISCLKLLIVNEYTFDIMTFEHDIYNNEAESKYRKEESIKILKDAGYKMMFENVLTKGTEKYNNKGESIWEPWEDWWVSKKYFDKIPKQTNGIKYIETLGVI
jgi:hypothetical protein